MWLRALCTMRRALSITHPRHRCITHPHRLFITTVAATGRIGVTGVTGMTAIATIAATAVTATEMGVGRLGCCGLR